MTTIIFYSLLLLALLFGSMFFSSADMAYGSISLKRLSREMDSHPGSGKRKTAYRLAKDYDKTISTILLCNDTINAALDTVSTLLGVVLAITVFGITNEDVQEFYGLIASIVVLVFKITFCEIIAKSLGKIWNLRLSVSYAPIINAFYWGTIPVTYLVGGFGKFVSYPILRFFPENKSQEDDLQEMIDEGEEKGAFTEEEAELLRGTVEFAQAKAFEILTPRVKVFAVSANEPASVILNKPEAFTHSRLPVYENTIDNILGYVRLKDIIALKLKGKSDDIRPLIRPLMFVHRSEEVSVILEDMRQKKTRIAGVMDEYGGFEGIVTVEDIIEEIVGEIWDETDHAEEPFVERGEDSYIADGSMNLEDLFNELDIDYDEVSSDSETLSGFLTELALEQGKDSRNLQFGGYNFKVLAFGARKVIRKVLITKIESEDGDKSVNQRIRERFEKALDGNEKPD